MFLHISWITSPGNSFKSIYSSPCFVLIYDNLIKIKCTVYLRQNNVLFFDQLETRVAQTYINAHNFFSQHSIDEFNCLQACRQTISKPRLTVFESRKMACYFYFQVFFSNQKWNVETWQFVVCVWFLYVTTKNRHHILVHCSCTFAAGWIKFLDVVVWVWTLVFFKNLTHWFQENSWLTKSKSHEFPDSVAGYELRMQTRHYSVLVLGVPRPFFSLIANFFGFVVCFNVVLRVRHFLDVATITDSLYFTTYDIRK